MIQQSMDFTDLSTVERDELARYEKTIERGLETFVKVGNALLAIRRDRLYRVTHATFEEYCVGRWQMTRAYADRLIGAAEVVGNLTPIGVVLPTTESQARPLTKLEPEQQIEAWQEAVETAPNGKVTAAHVERVVDSKMAVHYSSETPEHYTPKEIVGAVLICLGHIDLDPCSNSKTNPNVPAAQHYTIDDDGLAQSWHGRVYMNPPYGREIGRWVEKLCAEYEAGNTTEAIALVPARTDTDWFDRLIDGYRFHCFVHGRLQFIGNDGNAPFPSAIVYLGTEWGRFYQAFCSFGRVVQETHPAMFGD